jgi:general secretion pathway protein L
MRWTIAQLGSSDVQALAAGALRWWLRELRSLVPERIQQLIHKPRSSIVIDLIDSEIGVSFYGEGKPFDVGRIVGAELGLPQPPANITERLRKLPGIRNDVIVRLPSEKLLRKVIQLPLAAGRRLRPILAHEIERQTPLELAQIYFDYRVLARDKRAATLTIELFIVKREMAERAQTVARWLGLEANGIGLIDDAVFAQRYDLLPSQTAPGRKQFERRVTVLLTSAAMLLAVATIAAWIWQQQRSASVLAAQLVQLRGEAQTVAQLRKDIDDTTNRLAFLPRLKQQPQLLKIVDEVTRILPDGTWLFDLEIDVAEVRLRGYSTEASKLIAAFDDSTLFTKARFRAPVTQEAQSQRERFDLSFDIRGAEEQQ